MTDIKKTVTVAKVVTPLASTTFEEVVNKDATPPQAEDLKPLTPGQRLKQFLLNKTKTTQTNEDEKTI